MGFNSYLVKLYGSGRLSKRRHQFLQPIIPYLSEESCKPVDEKQTTEELLCKSTIPNPKEVENSFPGNYSNPDDTMWKCRRSTRLRIKTRRGS